MIRYVITFTDGSSIGICLNYEPQPGDTYGDGFLFPKTIDTVVEA